MRLSMALFALTLMTHVHAQSFKEIKLTEGTNEQTVTLKSEIYGTVESCSGTGDDRYCSSLSTELIGTTETTVSLSVEESPDFNVAGEVLKVKLSGERLYISSNKSSKTVFLIDRVVKSRTRRNSKITSLVSVKLIPRDAAEIKGLVEFRNLAVKDKILSFETGVEGDKGATQLSVLRRYWFVYASAPAFDEVLGERVKVEPIAGGLRHSFDLRETGLNLKGQMNLTLIRSAGLPDTHDITNAEQIRVKY
jgi:hypothetical protein